MGVYTQSSTYQARTHADHLTFPLQSMLSNHSRVFSFVLFFLSLFRKFAAIACSCICFTASITCVSGIMNFFEKTSILLSPRINFLSFTGPLIFALGCMSSSAVQIKNFVDSSCHKSCSLDPLPASILEICTDILLSVITRIVNTSLETATMPTELKNAVLTPKIHSTMTFI